MGREIHDRIRGERTDVLAIALDGLDEEEVAALTNALPVLESLAKTIRGRSL
jgi:hypothetical protein